MDLNNTLKQFDAALANLGKLDRIWQEIEPLLPSGNEAQGVERPDTYRDCARRFEFIAATMPKIDGFALEPKFPDPDSIIGTAVDYLDVRDEYPIAILQFHESLREPGEQLREYRFRLGVARRKLARDNIGDYIATIDRLLEQLTAAADGKEINYAIEKEPDFESLRTAVKSIDALLGNAADRPPRWHDMSRHLHFGLIQDLNDIVRMDWPASREGLMPLLYGEDDPLPIHVADLGTLVASKPSGPVTVELKWDRLSPSDFERLIFNLVDKREGYENPAWLTHTNATDRGRDLSVYRVVRDDLVGSRRQRIIIACKRQSSVGMDDIPKLKEQMRFWSQPKVDELIIATSGRFSTDAVQWIEDHNERGELPRIEMWAESHLERLLALRPELIAEFNLR